MCYLYLFYLSVLPGLGFWPNIPFLAILGSSAEGEITRRHLRGRWYSALGRENVYGWYLILLIEMVTSWIWIVLGRGIRSTG